MYDLKAAEPCDHNDEDLLRFRLEIRFSIAALFAIAFGTLAALPPALAQGSYSYSWGDSRVVNSNQSGLVHPSGSYIGPGTMSQSAKGYYGTGIQTNPGLPRVNMGANVATPGDNMYGNNPTRVAAPAAPMQGGSNPGLPATRLGANVGTAGDSMRSDLNGPNQVKKEVFRTRYNTPMLLQGPQQLQQQMQQQPEASDLPPIQMGPGGVASYGDVQLKQGIHF
jgi:hypothetical protein